MSNLDNEEILTGGNVTNVYRIANEVRREMGNNSEYIHNLLLHLEKKGYAYSPRFLGIDEKGRERLSFIEGEAGNDPVKAYMWSDENLSEIARMLRLYHDAVSDFPLDESWQCIDNTPQPLEVICHNDIALYNLVFKHNKPVGVIDFDVAAPGPRIWDIAYTLYTCIPLSRAYEKENGERVDYQSTEHAEHIKRRVHMFFHSYGADIRDDYLEVVLLRLEGLCKTIRRKADEGDLAFKKMIEEGHIDHYKKEIEFISQYGKEWA